MLSIASYIQITCCTSCRDSLKSYSIWKWGFPCSHSICCYHRSVSLYPNTENIIWIEIKRFSCLHWKKSIGFTGFALVWEENLTHKLQSETLKEVQWLQTWASLSILAIRCLSRELPYFSPMSDSTWCSGSSGIVTLCTKLVCCSVVITFANGDVTNKMLVQLRNSVTNASTENKMFICCMCSMELKDLR